LTLVPELANFIFATDAEMIDRFFTSTTKPFHLNFIRASVSIFSHQGFTD